MHEGGSIVALMGSSPQDRKKNLTVLSEGKMLTVADHTHFLPRSSMAHT